MKALSFIPGTGEVASCPLGRYLPPVTSGTISAWLKDHIPSGSWILDPIGFSPSLDLEAARAGYRVLVACNNPVIGLMLEVLANAPAKKELQSVLAELSLMKRGDERLDIHLQSLYLTTCPGCKQTIQAQGYLWKRGDKEPFARLIHCPHCGEEGEYPLLEEDIARLTPPGNPALHRARAIERASLQDDEIRPGVEEALRVYLPRPLYFLTTLINKIEGVSLSQDRRRLLWALILTLCDDANSLWPWPSGRIRPRQLTASTQFRENNLWLALENAVQSWSSLTKPLCLTVWPQLPPSSQDSTEGCICLFRGRLKSLLPLPPDLKTVAAITAFPRPSQAFWTLSAIWSGWLWGREAVQPLKAALDRRRYDWDWHATALHSSFVTLSEVVPDGFPFFGVMPEAIPGFLGALVLAAQAGGFKIDGFALREDDATAQFTLSRGLYESLRDSDNKNSLGKWIPQAIQNSVSDRHEPVSYMTLYAAGLLALHEARAFGYNPQANLRYFSDLSNKFEAALHASISNPHLFQRYGGSEQNIENGLWRSREVVAEKKQFQDEDSPLHDRIEKELVLFLQKNPASPFMSVIQELCQLFPGLLTPTENYIKLCLESYAEPQNVQGVEAWSLRAEDTPSARRQDLQNIQTVLMNLAHEMNLDCSEDLPVIWKASHTNQILYAFYPIASCLVSKWVFSAKDIPGKHVLVFPGGRARLLAYKLLNDPYLAEAARGWHFLKFRTLRLFMEQKSHDLPSFEHWLDGDPPDLNDSRQPSLFDA